MPTTTVPWWNYSVVYWLDDQVALTFHSDITLLKEGAAKVIDSLRLTDLNDFLHIRGLQLHAFEPKHTLRRPVQKKRGDRGGQDDSYQEGNGENERYEQRVDDEQSEPDAPRTDINTTTGKYLFPSSSGKGTTVVSYFTVAAIETAHHWQDAMMADVMSDASKAKQVVNLLNHNLERLRQDVGIPLLAAAPNWVGGANCFGHGCPVFPPFPVPESDSCVSETGVWPISLPDIPDASPICNTTGQDVTVFVLDSMPLVPEGATEHTSNVISGAANGAGTNNALIHTITTEMDRATSPYVDFYHTTLPDALLEGVEDTLVTGRDINGKRYGFSMPDHGLFVTGIIQSLAPNTNIEYVRVLNDFGIGDSGTLVAALEWIHDRMLPGNDLHNKPVVINMSLVMTPSDEDLFMNWFGDSCNCSPDKHVEMMNDTKLLRTPLHVAIQALAVRGAVLVASAGNDSNSIDMPGRIGPRYPAAFPEVLSVGAVDRQGEMAHYSNYPQLAPQHNGIATYGGGVPTKADIDRDDIDAFVGLYSAPTYPALEAKNPPLPEYPAPNKNAWAYWSGTSFATPIISAVAARILEYLQPQGLQARHVNAEVQWALTSALGQQSVLGTTLQTQKDFGVSLLRAVQCVPIKHSNLSTTPIQNAVVTEV
ncbi:MAG: hypothetical protein NVS4B12_05160 [Ktedonobacteraceae bacterium]